jgi:hypothetical protein
MIIFSDFVAVFTDHLIIRELFVARDKTNNLQTHNAYLHNVGNRIIFTQYARSFETSAN